MPIIEDTDYFQGRVQAAPYSTTSVTTGMAIRDFWQSENSVANLAEGLGALATNRFEADPDYDPEFDMDGYEGYADDLRGARSRMEMAHLKSKIDEENRRRETFAMADGWQKAAAIGTLIASDPMTLLPIGGTAYQAFTKGGKILEGAAKTAGVAAAAETFNETIIQANQITRTAEESIYNVAGATVIGGILGGAAGALSKVEYDNLLTKIDNDFTVPTGNQLSSVGAAQVGTTLDDEAVKGLRRAKAVWDKMPAFAKNPVFETALSPSKYVRELSEKLADLSLVKNKNTKFIASEASVETLIKGYQALQVPFFKAEKDLYKAYKQRFKNGDITQEDRIGSHKTGMLTRQEFNEQVWWAGIHNDQHAIKEVADLAKVARESVFNPILKRSEEVGIFKDIDELDVKTADSWMKRMYDREKIINERNDFKKIVVDDLLEKRQAALDEIEAIRIETGVDQKLIDDIDFLNKEREFYRRENFPRQKTKEVQGKLEQIDKRLAQMSANIDQDLLKKLSRLEFKAAQTKEEIDDIAEQLIDRITNATAGRLPYDMKLEGKNKGPAKVGLRGSAKARVWDIRDEKIKDYLVKDVRALMQSHIHTMAPDNELMGKFGTLDFDVVKKQIQENYNILRGERIPDPKTGEYRPKTNEELAKLEKAMRKDIRHVRAMWDKLRGIYAQPDDYAAPIHVLERSALGLNFMRLLGDVVASSIPDMARPIMVHGFNRTYGKLMKTLISDMQGWKMSKAEMEEIGTTLDIANSMTTLRRFNMDEYMPTTGRIDELMQKGSNAFALATGMNHWNAIMKTFSGVMTQNRMLDGIIELSETGKLGTKEMENLASHGIDRDMAVRIAEQYKKYGETRKVLKVANARDWDDTAARNAFKTAVRKQVDEIIVTPGLDRPLWMSRPGWKTIGQFKSFSFSATQRVLMAGMQQGDANYFAGITAGIFVGSLVYAYKTMMAGKPVSDDPRVWIAEGVDRSGITGIAMDVNNIVEKLTRGTIGINSLAGGPPMSRYASRNIAGTLLGPSFGMMQDMGQVSGAVFSGDWRESDVHAVRRLLPGQNLPYMRSLFDEAENGVNRVMGTRESE